MNDVNELVISSVELLRNNSISTTNYTRPYHPTCIVYFGQRSTLHHPEMLKNITRGWGGNADYVRFYNINDPKSDHIEDTISKKSLGVAEVQKEITDLLSSQNVFHDMTRIALYCILDTTDIKDPNEFAEWYVYINRIKEIIGVPMLSMLMVVLNESLHLTEAARGITNKLREVYQSDELGHANSHLYDSVFIVGNRLKNGAFVKLDPTESEYTDFNLPADVVLLTNTKDDDYGNRCEKLYGNAKPALTAAYGLVQKPMEEIVMVSLDNMLKKLKERTTGQKLGSEEAFMEALNIKSGKMYDAVYENIQPLLPPDEFVNLLPNDGNSHKTFGDLNVASCGCLQLFVQYNHVRTAKLEIEKNRARLQESLINNLSACVNAAQMINGVSDEMRKAVFKRSDLVSDNADGAPVSQAIVWKVKKAIAQDMQPIINEAIDDAVRSSQKCIAAFKDICDAVDKMVAVGEEGTRKNISGFYSEKIDRYFSDANKLNGFFNRVFNIRNDKKTILQLLHSELK